MLFYTGSYSARLRIIKIDREVLRRMSGFYSWNRLTKRLRSNWCLRNLVKCVYREG